MPKRKRRERKMYRFIHGIKHKHCGKCNQWKPLDQFGKRRNGKQSSCKACKKKKNKESYKIALEKRKKAREMAPTGFLVCLFEWCTVKGLQPVDQFIHPHVRNDKPTSCCLTCRNKSKEDREQRYTACQKVWDDWRKTHPCVKCMNDPNYEHNYLLIEADHLGGKVKKCSDMGYWSHSQRGVPALRAELMKCQASCKFHHALVTQQRNRDNGKILKQKSLVRKRAIMNKEKHKRGCCSNSKCDRVLKEGEECGFHFDHRDASTKFMYNGKRKDPSDFVDLPQALFNTQWPLEQAKCDLLCANCHVLKSRVNKDGYKKLNVKK